MTLKLIYLCFKFTVPVLYDVFKTKGNHPHAYATLVDCDDLCVYISLLPNTFKLFGFLVKPVLMTTSINNLYCVILIFIFLHSAFHVY